MGNLKIFRKAIDIYGNNYEELLGIEKGVTSAFSAIFNVLNSIRNRILSENEKNRELQKFKQYVNKLNNDIKQKKIFDVKKETFISIYNLIFNNETLGLSIEELSVLCGYMQRLVKSKISQNEIRYGIEEEINVDIYRSKRIEELNRLKEQEEQEDLERRLESMSLGDSFRYHLNNAPDIEKFATDEFKKLTSENDTYKIVKAKVLLEFYSNKENKTKKVKEKIKKLNEIIS